jgi:hypothetical protein
MRLALLADWKLLVEHARNHQTHDLALARGQRLVALAQPGKVTLLLAHHRSLRCPVNCIQQVLVQEGLGQELHRAGL